MTSPEAALLVATALHAGFQATVTLLVYPALAEVSEADWSAVHDRHSRRITPLVAVVYGAALGACCWVLLTDASPGAWIAAAGTAAAVLVTAAVAAPTHGRLGRRRTPDLVARLLLADRVRLGCTLVALVGAVLAAW